jgi:hypothetical protein
MTAPTLQKGMVIRGHLVEVDPPKIKIFILAAIDSEREEAKIILVGSRMTKFARKNPDLRDRHIPIDPSDYPGILDHLSYLNCSTIVTISVGDLTGKLQSGEWAHKGSLQELHLQRMVDEVSNAKTVKGRDKRLIAAPLDLSVFGGGPAI